MTFTNESVAAVPVDGASRPGLEALLFLMDVDGVLTDERATVPSTVLEHLVNLLRRGARIAFVTGRSTEWLEENLVRSLRFLARGAGVPHEAVALAAEMGAMTRAGLEAPWSETVDFALKSSLRDELRAAFESGGHDEALLWDATKQVMVSVESRHELDYALTQAALEEWFRVASGIAEAGGVVCQRSVYAVDVLRPGLTKAVGAAFGIEALREPDMRRVFVFGDTASDIAMAEAARDAGAAEVRFVWLGAGEVIAPQGVYLDVAREPFWRGTVEVLSQWN
jgi:phosphoglycolate phosphatase-like HAD superfamily hydrolase